MPCPTVVRRRRDLLEDNRSKQLNGNARPMVNQDRNATSPFPRKKRCIRSSNTLGSIKPDFDSMCFDKATSVAFNIRIGEKKRRLMTEGTSNDKLESHVIAMREWLVEADAQSCH